MIQDRERFLRGSRGAAVAALTGAAALGTVGLRLRAASELGIDMGSWLGAVLSAGVAGIVVGVVCGALWYFVFRRQLVLVAICVGLLAAAWDMHMLTSGVVLCPSFGQGLIAAAEGEGMEVLALAGAAKSEGGAHGPHALAAPSASGRCAPPSELRYVSVLVVRKDDRAAGVELLGADGQTVSPMGGNLAADGKAHRINFVAPKEAFSVVTRGAVDVRSVTAFGWEVRVAGKVMGVWAWFIVGAVLVAGLGIVLTARAGAFGGWTGRQAYAIAGVWLLAYVVLLVPHLDTYAGGADSSGYLNSAELFRHGHLTHELRRPADAAALSDNRFVPLGFALRAGTPARLVPTYPPGLPLIYSVAMLVLPGRAAISLVILAHLVAGILLMAVFARQVSLSQGWALALAAILALCPVYVFMGLQPMSDVPALVWVLAAIVAAAAGRPLICGAAFAVAVLVRPSDLLALPALLLMRRWTWRELKWVVLAALPFALAEGFYNHALYGHAFRTGYGNPSSLFGWGWVLPTLRHYLRWFPPLFTPLIVLAAAAPFHGRIPGRTRAMLVAWALPFLCFYAAYFCTHETWWYLRFLLPSLPAWLAGAALVASGLLARMRFAPAGALVLLFAGVWLACEDQRLLVLESGRGNRVYQDSSFWLARHVPSDSVILCNVTGGALLHYTGLTFTFVGSPGEAAHVAAYARAAGRPLYAQFFPFEERYLPADPSRGRWQPLQHFGPIAIWRWDPRTSSRPR